MQVSHSLQKIQTALSSSQYTLGSLVEYYLQNISEHASLNVFLEVFESEARQQAQAIDQKIKAGTAGRLAGLVVGIKDVISYQNHHLTAGSRILEGFEAQYNATVIERLVAEDAIIIGRQNCDEFAMGSSNENSAYGVTRNPFDPSRVPGGSSGASAVAIQKDMCLLSIGSDTGGSVRQPAAFCGVTGLKPTYGRISRHGLVAYASSFDCIGLIAKDTEDIAKVLEIIAGVDNFDSTASEKPSETYLNAFISSAPQKIAYFSEILSPESALQPEIRESLENTIASLKQKGHTVEPINAPWLSYILPVYYILTTAEASTNLSRYDGVRYGFRSSVEKGKQILEAMYKESRTIGFGKEVKKRIILGTFVLSADYFDAYYSKAQKVRRLIAEATQKIFQEYDFILSPTTPTTAFEIGVPRKNPVEMYLEDLFTVQANVVGIPAISFPVGFDQKQLPIGLQLMANHFEEAKLLSFSKELIGK